MYKQNIPLKASYLIFVAVLSADYSDRVHTLLAAVCLWGSRQPREDHCDGRLLLPKPSGPKDISLSWYVFTDGSTLIRANVDLDFFLSLCICACSRRKANRDVRRTYSTCKFLVWCRRYTHGSCQSILLNYLWYLFCREKLRGKSMGCSFPLKSDQNRY